MQMAHESLSIEIAHEILFITFVFPVVIVVTDGGCLLR
jgi:hypothetical protein